MRIAYISDPPNDLTHNEQQDIVERIKKRRGDVGLLPLDCALLHAPHMADGWNNYLGAIRTQSSLPSNLREIAICRPALLNEAWFEWMHHAPLLQESDSFKVDPQKMETVQTLNPQTPGALNEQEWAVLQYADSMTRHVKVPEQVFDGLRSAGFSDQEIVELTLTISTYNMVSRFLVALDVGEKNNDPPSFVKPSRNND